MTREAKIGMLTGLGVIVLIGVLLSEYLGGGVHPGMGGISPTGRMAELPMGAAYRQEITQPVGVPGLAPGNGAAAANTSGTPGLASGSPSMPAPAFASAATPATPSMDGNAVPAPGPIVNQPVAAVPANNVQLDTPVTRSLPTMQLPAGQNAQPVYVAGETAPAGSTAISEADPSTARPAAPMVDGKEYLIVPGDNLAKIARKFYKSSKNSDIDRIVAANPGMLKSAQSMLIAGRKLIIPTVAAAAPGEAPAAPVASNSQKKLSTIIHQPGSREKIAARGTAPEGAATLEPAKVYVVKSGDTLEKIAKRLSPDNVSAMVKKLMATNGIKDAKSLQVGAKLKIPSDAA